MYAKATDKVWDTKVMRQIVRLKK
ncbi:hypothetical protein [Wolbachia endosymbiont of Onchocerca gibsoni]